MTKHGDPLTVSLVQDCITMRLTTDEALQYLKIKGRPLGKRAYLKRKAHVKSDPAMKEYLAEYTKTGLSLNIKKERKKWRNYNLNCGIYSLEKQENRILISLK